MHVESYLQGGYGEAMRGWGTRSLNAKFSKPPPPSILTFPQVAPTHTALSTQLPAWQVCWRLTAVTQTWRRPLPFPGVRYLTRNHASAILQARRLSHLPASPQSAFNAPSLLIFALINCFGWAASGKQAGCKNKIWAHIINGCISLNGHTGMGALCHRCGLKKICVGATSIIPSVASGWGGVGILICVCFLIWWIWEHIRLGTTWLQSWCWLLLSKATPTNMIHNVQFCIRETPTIGWQKQGDYSM